MFKKVVAVAVGMTPVLALAAAQDYSSVQTALNTEISAAVPIMLGLFGTVAGVFLGVRLIKKGAKG